MKALILYGTRKGAARDCAEMVRDQIGGGDVVDVKKYSSANLESYDLIVLGSSVWMDKVHAEVRRFVEKNLPVLWLTMRRQRPSSEEKCSPRTSARS